jgi:hypothetical protein
VTEKVWKSYQENMWSTCTTIEEWQCVAHNDGSNSLDTSHGAWLGNARSVCIIDTGSSDHTKLAIKVIPCFTLVDLFLKWGFPEMGVPPNHPFLDGIFHEINHLFWGTPMTMETPK